MMTEKKAPASVGQVDQVVRPCSEAPPLLERLTHHAWLHDEMSGADEDNAGFANDLRAAVAEIVRLRAGHDRYEIVRRMNVDAFRDACVLNRRTGKPFDEIVADLGPFFGLKVRA